MNDEENRHVFSPYLVAIRCYQYHILHEERQSVPQRYWYL